jgi:hypothetical protein
MVRSLVAFAFSAAVSLTLAMPTHADPEDKIENGETETAPAPALLNRTYLPRRLETPDTRVTSCDVCAGLTCATVSVQGRCTVDKAMEALRQREGNLSQQKHRQRHRTRSVTEADFKPLAAGELPPLGRAEAGPKHQPQETGNTESRLLDVYESGNLPVSVRESNSLSVQAQSFRPLKLSDDAQDDEGDQSAEDGELSR